MTATPTPSDRAAGAVACRMEVWRRRSPHDREIARLAVPAFGALAAEPLYLLVDTAIVGHLGTDQLGGLAIAGIVLTVVFGLCNFLAYSTTGAVVAADRRRRPAPGRGRRRRRPLARGRARPVPRRRSASRSRR